MKIITSNFLYIGIFVCFFSYSFLQANPFFNNNFKLKTIVIDAGHGGQDPGCKGDHSIEKELALNIALKVGEKIEKTMPDVKVIYTRKDDRFIELNQRAKIANDNNADLFISIHCNASANHHAKGSETFVMGLHRSDSNLSVAKRENMVILLEEDYSVKYDGFDPNSTEGHILFSLYQNAYLEQSITFAHLVEEKFKAISGRASRGVKQAGFLVLYKTTMPSVLIEAGFLTNNKEEKYLQTTQGQQQAADAIYQAFQEYKSLVE